MKRTETTIATPTAAEFAELWAGWEITPEQAERIKAQDWDACAKFYEDNFRHLERLAYHYVQHKEYLIWNKWNADEILQCAYLDLPYMDYRSAKAFVTLFCNGTCYFSAYGGLAYLKENNPKKFSCKEYREDPLFIMDEYTGDGGTDACPIIDLNAWAQSVPEEVEADRERDRLVRIEADLPGLLREILTPKQYEAWSKGNNTQAIADRLKANAATVCAFLAAHGTDPARLCGQIETKEQRAAKLAEKRARARWEEEHLDELTPRERIRRLSIMAARRSVARKRAEAKARATV